MRKLLQYSELIVKRRKIILDRLEAITKSRPYPVKELGIEN